MRMRLHSMAAFGFAIFCGPTWASISSYRNANPVGWMHLLPVGEMPGWSGAAWTNVEINHANIWNMKFDMKDRRSGKTYTYMADYEQSSMILELGAPLSEDFALAVEIPYANRNGGFLDDFIDQFHQLIHSDRFLRHLNDDYKNSYSIQNDGQERLATERGQGVGSIKTKLKYWFLKWQSPTPGVCDCGVGVSAQVKAPLQRHEFGLSSGGWDYSGVLHAGMPLLNYSAIWATTSVTKLGSNDTFEGWPRREWLQMYELSMDFGFDQNWGMIFQGRYESPLFMVEHLDYQYTANSEKGKMNERVASGWNALTAWRGSQSIGFRYRWGQGSRVNLLFIEDWGLGDKDNRGEWLYVNNAPDIALISQLHFSF